MRRTSLSPPLASALSAAAGGGDRRPLYDLLCRASWLPGTNANVALAKAFADDCAAIGAPADALAVAMARLDADEAPGGTELEFLPMCGVAAIGARAAKDERARPAMLAELHTAADDLRFRVRAMVPTALAGVGGAAGSALIGDLEAWLDGYFHAAAVLIALADPGWSARIDDPAAVTLALDRAFTLARDANRAASRYPGHKALVEALTTAPAALAMRFGVPVFDLFVLWADATDPAMRDVVAKLVASSQMRARFGAEVARVRAALDASTKAPRDPTRIVQGTRGRGRRR